MRRDGWSAPGATATADGLVAVAKRISELTADEEALLLDRRHAPGADIERAVAAIVADVRARGEGARRARGGRGGRGGRPGAAGPPPRGGARPRGGGCVGGAPPPTWARQPLVGQGLGTPAADVTYLDASGRLQYHTDAHNTWLSIAAEKGLVGVAAFAVLLVLAAAALLRVAPRVAGRGHRGRLGVRLPGADRVPGDHPPPLAPARCPGRSGETGAPRNRSARRRAARRARCLRRPSGDGADLDFQRPRTDVRSFITVADCRGGSPARRHRPVTAGSWPQPAGFPPVR
jgi:hypothetical protein